MHEGYHYDDVPAILEALAAEGLPLSAGRVRQRRGDKGSKTSLQEDINVWKREHGMIEGPGDDQDPQPDQEDCPPRLLLALPAGLPAPDPEVVASALTTARHRVNLIVASSHLKAAVAALRCTEEALATVVPFMNGLHARRETQQGISGMNRSNPPFSPALGSLARYGQEVRAAYATLWQAVTLAVEEGKPHGDGFDPAA